MEHGIVQAKVGDLELPEYAAFNQGQNLPPMRRWELPFALFEARLENTASILDCTINPVNFRERMSLLYRHTFYRSWNPIQNGRFSVPLGVPDRGFDRVVCVNTLEHLLKGQRRELMAAMVRKLKPGGWLILTSDFYFDSLWERPELLKAGLLRADRQEVFNGFNKVTPVDWMELCRPHGLAPVIPFGSLEEPDEHDPSLLRNQEPHPHALIGGVFSKPPHQPSAAGRRIVLGIVTFNTRDVSVKSVEAYIEEARMLRRLGHEPFICVVDNASQDGTVEYLRELDERLDLPHRFVCRSENGGASVGRNLLLDYRAEIDADYVFLLDGDEEIVPFSSFAMMRYMEDSGCRLGGLTARPEDAVRDRSRRARCFYSVDEQPMTSLHTPVVSPGIFRREVFEAGARFDEVGLSGPGYGFEDEDFQFQLRDKGFAQRNFFGMAYIHAAQQAWLSALKNQGFEYREDFLRRRQYLVEKWTGSPSVPQSILEECARVPAPLV